MGADTEAMLISGCLAPIIFWLREQPYIGVMSIRLNLGPCASKYWRFKSFILHFISPFTITHLFK